MGAENSLMTNVASANPLGIRIIAYADIWEPYLNQVGYPDVFVGEDGVLPEAVFKDVTSGYVVGRVAGRDAFWTAVEAMTGRSYSKQRVNGMIEETRLFDQATYSVQSTPFLPYEAIWTAAEEAAGRSRSPRGGRKPSVGTGYPGAVITDVSGGAGR